MYRTLASVLRISNNNPTNGSTQIDHVTVYTPNMDEQERLKNRQKCAKWKQKNRKKWAKYMREFRARTKAATQAVQTHK